MVSLAGTVCISPGSGSRSPPALGLGSSGVSAGVSSCGAERHGSACAHQRAILLSSLMQPTETYLLPAQGCFHTPRCWLCTGGALDARRHGWHCKHSRVVSCKCATNSESSCMIHLSQSQMYAYH